MSRFEVSFASTCPIKGGNKRVKAAPADILSVAESLGADLKPSGIGHRGFSCPVCGGRGCFSINRQFFKCFRRDVGGDVIALVRHTLNVNRREAERWLNSENWTRVDREAFFDPYTDPTSDKFDKKWAWREGLWKPATGWREIWERGVDPRGTVVERYLENARLS